jgi:hypothetical protein
MRLLMAHAPFSKPSTTQLYAAWGARLLTWINPTKTHKPRYLSEAM